MTTWYDSKIIRIEQESGHTRRFWIQIASEEIFHFEAGQFVTMDLPISDRRTKRWRSYSIASAPDGTNVLEFCIVLLEGGAGTTYLFENAVVGTPIRFKGPDGGFVLKQAEERDIVMICTGTGLAPFRSMLLDVVNRGVAVQNIHLIFGARLQSDILYRTELEELASKFSWFQYDVALSRESDKDWKGHKGYVHPIYLEAYKNIRPNVCFYICGWSKMVDEAIANLLMEMGYERTQVFFELYG